MIHGARMQNFSLRILVRFCFLKGFNKTIRKKVRSVKTQSAYDQVYIIAFKFTVFDQWWQEEKLWILRSDITRTSSAIHGRWLCDDQLQEILAFFFRCICGHWLYGWKCRISTGVKSKFCILWTFPSRLLVILIKIYTDMNKHRTVNPTFMAMHPSLVSQKNLLDNHLMWHNSQVDPIKADLSALKSLNA